MIQEIQLNTRNLGRIREQAPEVYDWIRLDTNNNCNLRCLYCHNPRTKDLMQPEELRAFLRHNVLGVKNLQIGCGMEPTLDPRLCEFMQMIAESPAKPECQFKLQTNGVLLHQHDPHQMNSAGLTHLAVSIDSADPAMHRTLRRGADLNKIKSNLLAFREALPHVAIEFKTTVTALNVDGLGGLLEFGLALGVRRFMFRQMFYHPDSKIVDHEKMPGLLVPLAAFERAKERLQAQFGRAAQMWFMDSRTLVDHALQVRQTSQLNPKS